jgi:hypothetical protein
MGPLVVVGLWLGVVIDFVVDIDVVLDAVDDWDTLLLSDVVIISVDFVTLVEECVTVVVGGLVVDSIIFSYTSFLLVTVTRHQQHLCCV